LSLNFTVVEGGGGRDAVVFGNESGRERWPRRGFRVRIWRRISGRHWRSTDEEQKKAGFGGEAPADIITTNSRKAKVLTPEGIAADQLTGAQKQS